MRTNGFAQPLVVVHPVFAFVNQITPMAYFALDSNHPLAKLRVRLGAAGKRRSEFQWIHLELHNSVFQKVNLHARH
jgi:hypothetical protein